jgi:N-acetylmuramic acid 6-phosphate etherase
MEKKITEQASHHQHLEKMSTDDLLLAINQEDRKVSMAVYNAIPYISSLVEATYLKMKNGGRLFYMGAGTSGRLGILDASECPPTYGVPHEWVIGLIAGGDGAIRKAVEFAEDDIHLAMKDLEGYDISSDDVVVGIAASGTTPYVVHGLKDCKSRGIITGCITCNPKAPVIEYADHPIIAVVGPEFVTGSTRMKSGTAQKLILNMITTSVMVKLGRVEGNKMVDMQLSNNKLWDRGSKMLVEKLHVTADEARNLLVEYGSVRKAVEAYEAKKG